MVFVRRLNLSFASSKMWVISAFCVSGSFVLALSVLGQDALLPPSAGRDFITDSTRLRVSALDIENRSMQPQVYLTDARFVLQCIDTSLDSSMLTDLQWIRIDPFTSAMVGMPLQSSPKIGRTLNATVRNITPGEGGYYVCRGQTLDGQTIRSEPIKLSILSDRALAAQLPNVVHRRDSNSENANVTLKCDVIMTNPLPVLWKWQRLGETRLQDISGVLSSSADQPNSPRAKYTTSDNGQKLTIHNVTISDIGDYTCLFDMTLVNPGSWRFTPNQTIHLSLAPLLKPLVGSNSGIVSHIVGDSFELKCIASVYPPSDASLEWYHDGKPLNVTNAGNSMGRQSDDAASVQRVAVNERINVTNSVQDNEWLMSTLHLSEVHSDDAGNYTCLVRSAAGEQKRMVFLKVKDKFAALYPFLIILGEVIVLVGIIFIYERRHNRKAAQEYRADAGDDDEEAQPVNTARHV